MDEYYMFHIDKDGLFYSEDLNNRIFTSKETAFWYYTWIYLNIPNFKHFECYLKVYRKSPSNDYIFNNEVIKLTIPQGTIQRIFKRHNINHKDIVTIELDDIYNYKAFSDKEFRYRNYA
jgi:hypothetical protein